VLLVSDSRELLIQVSAQVDRQLQTLPRRAIAEQALEKSALLLVQNRGQMLDLCNAYAPEHLILQIAEAREFALAVRHAGSVFLGPWTPESAGDYASGTNHVLPTYGFARAYGGLTTESFLKTITFQEITRRGLDDLGPVVERLALAEGLHGHANAVRIRLEAAP
jgi:histidinol dehydrogenase